MRQRRALALLDCSATRATRAREAVPTHLAAQRPHQLAYQAADVQLGSKRDRGQPRIYRTRPTRRSRLPRIQPTRASDTSTLAMCPSTTSLPRCDVWRDVRGAARYAFERT